jgi:hypothetical protein
VASNNVSSAAIQATISLKRRFIIHLLLIERRAVVVANLKMTPQFAGPDATHGATQAKLVASLVSPEPEYFAIFG